MIIYNTVCVKTKNIEWYEFTINASFIKQETFGQEYRQDNVKRYRDAIQERVLYAIHYLQHQVRTIHKDYLTYPLRGCCNLLTRLIIFSPVFGVGRWWTLKENAFLQYSTNISVSWASEKRMEILCV